MAKQVGKTLREENLEKFDQSLPSRPSIDTNSESKSSFNSDNYGFGELGTITAQDKLYGANNIAESPFDNDYFDSKLWGFNLGPVTETAYERRGFNSPFNSEIDFEKIKADNQSGIVQAGALATQFTGKTLVGTVGNIIGGFYGVGSAIANGDKSKLFDNDFYRELDDVNASIEAGNTMFVNQADGLGFNAKTVKELSDAFSFIAAAVTSEVLMQTAGNAMGGAGILGLGGRMARYMKQVKQMHKMSKMLDNTQDLEKLAMRLGTTVDKLSSMRRNIERVKAGATMGRRMMTTTGYEAGLEARHTKDALLNDMTAELEQELASSDMDETEKEEYKAKRLKEIEAAADSAGIATFSLNTGLLSVSNAIQFPTIFGNSYIKGVKLGNITREGIAKIGKEKGTKAALKHVMERAGRVVKAPFTEFMEETGQGLFSNSSYNYYETMLGEKSNAGVLNPTANNISKSVFEAIKETYGTAEGLHEGIIGAIVGGVGLPGLRKGKKGIKKFTMNGGIWDGIRQNRDIRKQTESALNSLNDIPASDLLKYNKDNAIRSAIDGQREDLATILDNKIEFDAVKDNKTFRYTIDRLEKGLDEFIDEDISDLRDLANKDIDKYKEQFQKNKEFTKEDALKEINEFEEKVDIYKNAYKKVHQHYNVNLMRDDDVTKKLTDTLVHSVAAEKVWGNRLQNIKDHLFEITNGEFTKDEIDTFVMTSAKVAKAAKPYNNYVKQKNDEKINKQATDIANSEEYQKELKAINAERESILAETLTQEEVDEINNGEGVGKGFDEGESLSQEAKDAIDALIEKKDITLLTKEQQELLNDPKKVPLHLQKRYQINKETEAKVEALNKKYGAKIKNFNPRKSSTARKMKQGIDELVEQMNAEIEGKTSEAMKEISYPPKKLTRKELNEYMKSKEKIMKSIEKEYGSKSILDLSESEITDANELIDQMDEITDRLMTATNVAGYLYGFKKNPAEAYSRVLAGEFKANMANANKLVEYLEQLKTEGPSDEFKAYLEELEDIISDIDEDFPTIRKAFRKKFADVIYKDVQDIKDKIEEFKDFMGLVTKRAEQDKKALEEDPDTGDDSEYGEASEDDVTGMINDPSISDPDAGNSPNKPNQSPSTKKEIEFNNKHNRLGIREYVEDENGEVKESGFIRYKPEFKELLNNGGFKDKAPVSLQVDPDDQLNPENNSKLLESLNKYGEYDSYMAGYEKVLNDSSKLDFTKVDQLDDDVFTFVRFAPIQMNIYDTRLDPGKNYDYDTSKLGDPIYNQYLFVPDNVLKKDEREAQANAEYLEKLRILNEEERVKVAESKKTKDDYHKRIEALYNKKRNDLYYKYKANNNDSTSNMSYRLELLQNKFLNDTNELKLKIQHVDQGNFEYFNFQKKIVNEFDPSDPKGLAYEASKMTVDDIFYGDADYEYVRIDGKKTTSLINHPFATMDTSEKGKIYFKYKTQTGKEVPIKMNTAKIDNNHIEMITKQLHGYFQQSDRSGFRTKGTGVSFLDGLEMQEFLQFFMNPQWNAKSRNIIYLKNTFNVNPKNDGEILIYTGNKKAIALNNIEEFEKSYDDLVKKLKENRFTVRKQFLIKEENGKEILNKEVLEYMFENKIINHPFNVSKNFDKIFDPNDPDGNPYNKKLIISRANTRDTKPQHEKPKGYGEDIRELRNSLMGHNKDSNYEANEESIIHGFQNGIIKSIRAQIRNLPNGKPSAEKTKEIAKKAFDNVLKNRLDMIYKVADKHQNKIKGTDHETVYKSQPNDTEIDKFLRTVYYINNELRKDQDFLDTLAQEAELWGSKTKLENAFRSTSDTTPFSISRYTSKKDNQYEPQFTNQDQVDNFVNIAKKLSILVETAGTGRPNHFHIMHGEDYIQNQGKRKIWKYEDQSGITKHTAKQKHFKSRLVKVEVIGAPKLVVNEDGSRKIVDGSVKFYFNRIAMKKDAKGNWSPDTDEKGRLKIYVGQSIALHNSKEELTEANIMTDIFLPFVNPDMSTTKEFDKLFEDVEERAKLRDKANKKGTNKLIKAKGDKGYEDENMVYKDEDIDEKSLLGDVLEDEDAQKDVDDKAKKKGKKSDKKIKPIEINVDDYTDEMTAEVVNSIVLRKLSILPENRTDKDRERIKKKLAKLDINSAEKLIQIYMRYDKEGLVDTKGKEDTFKKQIVTFAEDILGPRDNNEC